jgi:hypothetical protein
MYAYIQDVPITLPVYRQIKEEIGEDVPRGLLVHLVLETQEGLRYVDVWESQTDCERFFDERVHPAVDRVLARVGHPRGGEPRREEIVVHEVWKA